MNTDSQEMGKGLAQIIFRIGYKLYHDKKFQKLIKFKDLPDGERSRIFNEIQVTFLGLFELYLHNLIKQVDDPDQKVFLNNLTTELKKGFLVILGEMSLHSEFLEQWKQLIDIRIAEYHRDFEILIKEGRGIKEFENNEGLMMTWARVETISLDGTSHITKDNLDENELLRRLLQQWIIELDQLFSYSVKQLIFKPQGIS